MTPESVFSWANMSVIPGWALLLFAPRWRWGTHFIAPVLIPAVLGAGYLVIMALQIGQSDGSFGSLGGVTSFFANPWLLLAGWIHYLAFDLFIGAWEVRDARRLGIHHLVIVPCLLFTFMLGPIGLAAYLAVRGVWMRKVTLDELDTRIPA